MPDLAAEYFKRELSQAEEEALAAQLRESPEAAERFLDAAEADYRRLGQPEPRQPFRFTRAYWLAAAVIMAAGAWMSIRPEAISQELPAYEERSAVLKEDPAPSRPQPGPADSLAKAQLNLRAEGSRFYLSLAGSAPSGAAAVVQDGWGRKVRELPKGGEGWVWDLQDGRGKAVKPGRYLMKLEAQGMKWTRWVDVLSVQAPEE